MFQREEKECAYNQEIVGSELKKNKYTLVEFEKNLVRVKNPEGEEGVIRYKGNEDCFPFQKNMAPTNEFEPSSSHHHGLG